MAWFSWGGEGMHEVVLSKSRTPGTPKLVIWGLQSQSLTLEIKMWFFPGVASPQKLQKCSIISLAGVSGGSGQSLCDYFLFALI